MKNVLVALGRNTNIVTETSKTRFFKASRAFNLAFSCITIGSGNLFLILKYSHFLVPKAYVKMILVHF